MDLEKIPAYVYLNGLVINLKKGKSEFTLFGSSQQLKKGGNLLNVMFEDSKIIFLTQYNYLGTIIDNHLNLNKNFNHSNINVLAPGQDYYKDANFLDISGIPDIFSKIVIFQILPVFC